MLFSYTNAAGQKGTIQANNLDHAAKILIGRHATVHSEHADGVSKTYQGSYYDSDHFEQMVITPMLNEPRSVRGVMKDGPFNRLAAALGVNTLARWQKNYVRVIAAFVATEVGVFSTLIYDRSIFVSMIMSIRELI
jgi:hypothetical protein